MKAASRAIGRSETYVRDILERGREPGIDSFEALARILDVEVNDLLAPDALRDPARARLERLFDRLGETSSALQNEVINYAEYLLKEAESSKK